MMRTIVTLLGLAGCAWAAGEDGRVLFDQHCAACHRAGGANRTPTPEALKKLSSAAILAALDHGVMKAQGAGLTAAQRVAVAEFAGSRVEDAGRAAAGKACASNPPLTGTGGWNGWANDAANSRMQTAERAGLKGEDVPRLKLKWAFGFPDTLSVFGQPAIAGGRLYFGSSTGTVYSLDAASGCVYWTFKAPTTARTPISLGKLPDGRTAAYFGDTHASVYAVDAHSGELVWKAQAEEHKLARVTGAPKLVAGKLYVPVSSGAEEMLAAQATYPCCTFRGSVSAFDAATGKRLWRTYTIPDPAAYVKTNAAGTKLYGPSGAGVWSSPTIDAKRGVLYVGTGNNYSDPGTRYSDAVLAVDLETGSVRWVKQMNPGDAWNAGCMTPDKKNCPSEPGQDTDIGASPVLRTVGGRDVLVVAQKSGMVYGLDPDHSGEVIWQTRIGRGGALGGVMWGMAADESRVYVPLSDFAGPVLTVGGGLFALEAATGKVAWKAEPAEAACGGHAGCSRAQMAPATLIDGVVFSGSMDGHLRAYETAGGRLVWDFDTLRDFETVNGVAAHGGSLNATGPTAAGGIVYVNSGYGQLGGMPGNVLLAFSVDGK